MRESHPEMEQHDSFRGADQRRSSGDNSVRRIIYALLIPALLVICAVYQSYSVEWSAKETVAKLFLSACNTPEDEKLMRSFVVEAHNLVFKASYHAPTFGPSENRPGKLAIGMPWVDEPKYVNAMFESVADIAKKNRQPEMASRLALLQLYVASQVKEVKKPAMAALQVDRTPKPQTQTAAFTQPGPVPAAAIAQPRQDLIGFKVAAGLVPPLNSAAMSDTRVDVYYRNVKTAQPNCLLLARNVRIRRYTPGESAARGEAVLELDMAATEGAQANLKLNDNVGPEGVCLAESAGFGKGVVSCDCGIKVMPPGTQEARNFNSPAAPSQIAMGSYSETPEERRNRMDRNLGVERMETKQRVAQTRQARSREATPPPNPDPSKYSYHKTGSGRWFRTKLNGRNWAFDSFVDAAGQPVPQ